jgi:hypothetical protein
LARPFGALGYGPGFGSLGGNGLGCAGSGFVDFRFRHDIRLLSNVSGNRRQPKTFDHLSSFTGTTLMAKQKHPASEHHLKAAAHHAAAAHHHFEAAHQHDQDNHEEAKKHAASALDHSQDADRHSKTAHVHSQK